MYSMKKRMPGFAGSQKEEAVIFLGFETMIFLAYSLFLNQTYNCDQMAAAFTENTDNFGTVLKNYILGGRPVSIIRLGIDWFFGLFGIHYLNHQWVMQAFTMLLLGLDAFLLYVVIRKYMDESGRLLITFAVIIGFVNPFFVECFSFYGPDHALAVMLSIAGIYFFTKEKYGKSICFVFLSISWYQTYYSFFLIYACVCIYLKTKGNISFDILRKYVAACLTVAAAVLCNLFLVKAAAWIFGEAEVKPAGMPATLSAFFGKVHQVSDSYAFIFKNGYGFLPDYLVIVIVILFGIAAMLVKLYKKDFFGLAWTLVLSGCIFIAPAVYGLIMIHFYYPPRAAVPFFMALGGYLLITGFEIVQWENSTSLAYHYFSTGIEAVLAIFLILMVHRTQLGISDILTANRVEIQTCRDVDKYIKKYEQESRNTIEFIKVSHYSGAMLAFDHNYLNIRYEGYPSVATVLNAEWADVVMLNFVTGENYKKEKITREEELQYFGNYDKNTALRSFDPDTQLVFKENTLYWMLY